VQVGIERKQLISLMTHLPPIKTDEKKEKKERETSHTRHKHGPVFILSCYPEYGNRQQIHLQGRSLTANLHFFYPL
jgi:hypothetical protein